MTSSGEGSSSRSAAFKSTMAILIPLLVAVISLLGYLLNREMNEQGIKNTQAEQRTLRAVRLDAKLQTHVHELSEGKPTVRKHAVYELTGLARGHPKLRAEVVNALTDAILEWSPRPTSGLAGYGDPHPGETYEAAGQLRTLLQDIDPDGDRYKLDLADADLRGQSWNSIRLVHAYAEGIDLRGANLTYGRLVGAHLRDASLACATLTNAHLKGADIRGVDFTGANLDSTDLRVAYPRTLDMTAFAGTHWTEDTTWPGSPPDFESSPFRKKACQDRLREEANQTTDVSGVAESPAPSPSDESTTPGPDAPFQPGTEEGSASSGEETTTVPPTDVGTSSP